MAAGDSAQPDRPLRRAGNRYLGIILIIESSAIAVLGWVALAILDGHIDENPEIVTDIPPLAQAMIGQRMWLVAAVLPLLGGGVALLVKSRSNRIRWPLFILAELWLVTLFGLILYSFIMFLAPLYQYQPL